MRVNPFRVQNLSEVIYSGGTVIYHMCRDIRVHDNDALLYAQQLAKEHDGQLIVKYVIWNYLWEGATRRFYDWVIPSLQEVEEELRKHNIPLVITFQERKQTTIKITPEDGAVVIDQLPLHFMKRWKKDFLVSHKKIPLYEVDAHNCIPVWKASPKQEFAARTIRGKIHAQLSSYMEEFGTLAHHKENTDILETIQAIQWDDIRKKIHCQEDVQGIGLFISGEKAAKEMLIHFLRDKLTTYDSTRNDINISGQSDLSPYIAHGNISRRRIILQLLKETGVTLEKAFDAVKNGSNGSMGSVAAFIEECVVRSELAENYCFYKVAYNSADGFPEWAKVTLAKARNDTRDYVYSLEDFKHARTHDNLWNAAQRQMMVTGKMHGYMRMYWAKKILEWTKSSEDAMKIAVCLNDTYELDGLDPNGYVGCAWSIGGLHDRAWFGRPVFGTIRFMARSGVEKRGDVEKYIDRFLEKTQRTESTC